MHHEIVKYTHKSILHRLKNNLSQEDTWHDNCAGWHVERCSGSTAASAASHFKAKGADGPRCPRGGLFERVDPRPRRPHPYRIPPCVLSSVRPSCPVPLALKYETCIDYSIPPPEHRPSKPLREAILDCSSITLTACCTYLHFESTEIMLRKIHKQS